MTSVSSFRRLILGSAVVAASACLSATPLAAQDLRDIPQKTNSSVTAPQPQPKAAPRQGREVQGPPAPLETQLRDTPPDDPPVRTPEPAPAPVVQAPQPQVVARPYDPNAAQARPTAAPAQSRRGAAQVTPQGEARAPADAVNARAAASATGDATNEGVGAIAATPAPLDTNAVPAAVPSAAGSAVADSAVADPVAAPAGGSGDTMPWALGLAALLGLGGLGYWATRKHTAEASGAADYQGIELGQTPFHDPVTEPALPGAAKPVTTPVKAPPKSAAPPPAERAPEPVPPPVTPTSDGRIVSRLRAPVEDAPPPPEPVKPAADGRIVSRLKVTDFVAEDAVPEPAPPPRGPQVRTISVGYSTPKRET